MQTRSVVSHRAFHTAAVAVFALVALAQLLRASIGWPVVIAQFAIPPALSFGIAARAAALAVWGWRTRP